MVGSNLEQARRCKEAETALCAAIKLKPDRVGSYEVLGSMLEQEGCRSDATQVFMAATRVEPKGAGDSVLLGPISKGSAMPKAWR